MKRQLVCLVALVAMASFMWAAPANAAPSAKKEVTKAEQSRIVVAPALEVAEAAPDIGAEAALTHTIYNTTADRRDARPPGSRKAGFAESRHTNMKTSINTPSRLHPAEVLRC